MSCASTANRRPKCPTTQQLSSTDLPGIQIELLVETEAVPIYDRTIRCDYLAKEGHYCELKRAAATSTIPASEIIKHLPKSEGSEVIWLTIPP